MHLRISAFSAYCDSKLYNFAVLQNYGFGILKLRKSLVYDKLCIFFGKVAFCVYAPYVRTCFSVVNKSSEPCADTDLRTLKKCVRI